MRAAHARAVAAYTDALPHLDPPGRRVEIPFETGTLVAVVRTPYGEGPFPVVLMIPGLDSTKEEIRSTEQTFLDRGLATFSVDGPGQGEAEYDVKIRGDWGPVTEVLYDAIGRQSDLDRDRLGVWGVSLGGYYAVRVMAALGDRATAGVALAGPFNFGECWDGLPPLTRDTFRVRSGTASDEEARGVADTLDLSPVAGDVAAPMLLVFGRQDRLIPYRQAEKAHAAVPGSELLMLERGQPRLRRRTAPGTGRGRPTGWPTISAVTSATLASPLTPPPARRQESDARLGDVDRLDRHRADGCRDGGAARPGGPGPHGLEPHPRQGRAPGRRGRQGRRRDRRARRPRRRLHDGLRPRPTSSRADRRGWPARRPRPRCPVPWSTARPSSTETSARDARGVRRARASTSSPRRSAATARWCAAGKLTPGRLRSARRPTTRWRRSLDHLGRRVTYVGDGEKSPGS